MASTFSPSLRLELIGDGDQSGIWGQTTNNNLGGLVEQAIGGVVTISMIDANYTLTNFNGVVDEARNAVIVATGALSAQRNIIAPLVEKTYTIRNSTTGGFGVQIIGPSGTGVVIPNGVTASVFCNGTDFLSAFTGSTGNQSVNGNLLVTGTTTLTGALTASTGAFSGAISSVSPTFTGAPTAPTAAPGTNTTQIASTAFVQAATTALGLGTMSTQNANAVNITGGTMSGMTNVAGGTHSGTTATFSGAVSGASGAFSGAVSGTTATFTSGTFSGAMSAASLSGGASTGSGASGTWAIAISGSAGSVASGGTIASNVTATTQAVTTDNTTVATTAFVRDIIPTGVILMWSGSIASIPTGWFLCDGNNGTPNLLNRFIVGAGATYAVNATGGSADAVVVSHSHSATSTASGGTHHHLQFWNGTSGSESGGDPSLYPATRGNFGSSFFNQNTAPTSNVADTLRGASADATPTVATTVASAGVSGTNANLPPYFALAYIMKS
jgi:hypothetical protein